MDGDNICDSDKTNQSDDQRKSDSQHMEDSQKTLINHDANQIESHKLSHSKSHNNGERKVDNIQSEKDHGESQCHDDDQSDSQNLHECSPQSHESSELCDTNHCELSMIVTERLHDNDDDASNHSIPSLEVIADKTDIINDKSMIKSDQKMSSTISKRSIEDFPSNEKDLNTKTPEIIIDHLEGENTLENTKPYINVPSNASCVDLERSWTDKNFEEESLSLVTKVS